jgi:hypothetical protein
VITGTVTSKLVTFSTPLPAELGDGFLDIAGDVAVLVMDTF